MPGTQKIGEDGKGQDQENWVCELLKIRSTACRGFWARLPWCKCRRSRLWAT